MHSKPILLLILMCCAFACPAETKFKLTGKAELERGAQLTADVDYTGTLPPEPNPFTTASSWKVYWSDKPDSQVNAVEVLSVDLDIPDQKLLLHLAGGAIPGGASWTVLFNPAGPPYVLPQVISGSPTKVAPNSQAQQPTPPEPNVNPGAPETNPIKPEENKPAKKDCGSTGNKPAFCPVEKGALPDVSLTASYLAAGGTKPIYNLSLKGALQFSGDVLSFNPAISTDIEINQNLKPPVNSTTFDPDSITAGLTFTRVVAARYAEPNQNQQPAQDHLFLGAKLMFALPDFEFSTSDPSSNFIFNPAATFVLNSWQPPKHPSLYATLYPFMALEIGENISKPASIEKVPVNLANYSAIMRGVLGADAKLAITATDHKSDTFSLTGSYRVRLPAFDEPEVRTLHRVTTVDLTTKARHWFEGDINYAPWSFKYLAITGKYQYGELPPLFKLVDHCFTLGLTLQASQAHKQ
jgi:hypothetical protein